MDDTRIRYVGAPLTDQNEGIIIATTAQLQRFCQHIIAGHNVVVLDTETSGRNPHSDTLVMVQLATTDGLCYCIDARTVSLEPLREILEARHITKIGHNIKFDYKFLLAKGIRMNTVYDTMWAEAVLHCGLENVGYGLDKVVKRYLDIDLPKDVRKTFSATAPLQPIQVIYGARDVLYLPEVRKRQLEALSRAGLVEVAQLENRSALAFADIEYNGLGFDTDAWLRVADRQEGLMQDLLQQLDTMVCDHPKLQMYRRPGIQATLFDISPKRTTVDWNSPGQVTQLLRYLQPDIEDSTQRSLQKMSAKHPLARKLLEYRGVAKRASTYGKAFLGNINPTTGRIHTSFWQVVRTGRVSSGRKGEQAPNMQNIPHTDEYRQCFMARPGFKIVSVDYASQELRLIAEGSKDPVWLEAIAHDQDLHSVCAELVYGELWERHAADDCAYYARDAQGNMLKQKCSCKGHKALRTNVKTINFGLAYGMSSHKLSDTLSIDQQQAQSLIDKYFRAFPRIGDFLDALAAYGVKHAHIRTFAPFRRRRLFPEWLPDARAQLDYGGQRRVQGSVERQSKNTPIQGTAGDLTKLAMAALRETITLNRWERDVLFITQVHDEIGFEVREHLVDTWVPIQCAIMRNCGTLICRTVPMDVEATVSDRWQK